MFDICEKNLKRVLMVMLISSIPCLNALGIMVSSFSLYSIKKNDINLLKYMSIPFIFNVILLFGIFVICIIVDVITFKSYMDYSGASILTQNIALFIPLTIIVFILLLFQIYICIVIPRYIKKTLNNKMDGNSYTIIDENTTVINGMPHSPITDVSLGTYTTYNNSPNPENSFSINFNSLLPCIPSDSSDSEPKSVV